MAEVERDYFQGVLVPDERWSSDTLVDKGAGATDSDYTSAGPRPGTPQPQQSDGLMALEASHKQSQDGHLEVQLIRGGHPGTDLAELGFIDVAQGETGGDVKGWDSFQGITGFDSVTYTNVAPATDPPVHVIRLHSGKLLMCGVISNTNQHRTHRYDPDTSAWTQVGNPPVASLAALKCSCLLQLPTGRVLYYHVNQNPSQVDVYRSDDEGTTWVLHSAGVLEVGLQDSGSAVPTPTLLRAAYANGQVVLFVRYTDGTLGFTDLQQYASDDLGKTFEHVSDSFYADSGNSLQPRYIDLVGLREGGFAFITYEFVVGSGVYRYFARTLDSAYSPLGESAALQTLSSTTTDDCIGLAVWEDEDGTLYSLVNERDVPAVERRYTTWRSDNGGGSWDDFANLCWRGQNLSEHFDDYSIASTGGRAFCLSRFGARATAYAGPSVVVIELGGFSRHTLPFYVPTIGESNFDALRQHGWGGRGAGGGVGLSWFPIELPDNMGWNLSAGAAGTANLIAPGALQLSTGIGQQRSYNINIGGAYSKLIAEVEVEVDGGSGNPLSIEVGAVVHLSDGATYDHTLWLRVHDAGYVVFDPIAGAQVYAVNLDMKTTRLIRIAMEKGNPNGFITTWHCDDKHHREWVEDGNGNLQDGGGASGVASEIHFGNFTVGAAAHVSRWQLCQLGVDVDYWSARDQSVYAQSWTSPADLFGKSVSVYPYLLKDGVKVRASTGPGALGDKWDVEAEYDYPIEALDPHLMPSPSRPWRSITDAATVNIVWDLESASVDASYMENLSLGFALLDINFRQAFVQGYDGAAWQTVGTFNVMEGFTSLDYVRSGAKLRPDPAAAVVGQRYFDYHAHAGDHVDLGGGSIRKLARNTEGAWRGTGYSGKVPTLTIDPTQYDDTEPASGQLNLWRRNALLVVHNYSGTYDRWRLRIPAQSTAEGYFQVGQFVPGSFVIFGHQYDRGWETTHSPNVEVFERVNRSIRTRRLGRTRREYEMAWTKTAVDATLVELTGPNPDHLAGYVGGGGVATPYDVARVLSGLLERVEYRAPLVVARYIPQGSVAAGSSFQMLNDRAWLYGRIQSDVRVEGVVGRETVSEVERVQKLTVVEEV